jgi:hypothetical protein
MDSSSAQLQVVALMPLKLTRQLYGGISSSVEFVVCKTVGGIKFLENTTPIAPGGTLICCDDQKKKKKKKKKTIIDCASVPDPNTLDQELNAVYSFDTLSTKLN